MSLKLLPWQKVSRCQNRCLWRDSFKASLDVLSSRITDEQPAIVYICNPNSPTGNYIAPELLNRLISNHRQTTFVLDQAFIHMSPYSKDAWFSYPDNVIQVFSFTKDHSIRA